LIAELFMIFNSADFCWRGESIFERREMFHPDVGATGNGGGTKFGAGKNGKIRVTKFARGESNS
jgi:hypothetical protein